MTSHDHAALDLVPPDAGGAGEARGDRDPGSDGALFLGARAGDRAALEALVRRHQKGVYAACHKIVRDHDVAADLTQRAFLKVLENMDALRGPDQFRGWLHSIAINAARNHLRYMAKFVRDAEPTLRAPGDTHAGAEEAAQWALVARALPALPQKQRRCFELRVYERLSFGEVARRMHSTTNAVKVNFHFAVKRLRATIWSDRPAAERPAARS
jgi:RNA polymerase sigma-70 factor (ECF subfamily)